MRKRHHLKFVGSCYRDLSRFVLEIACQNPRGLSLGGNGLHCGTTETPRAGQVIVEGVH